MTATARQARPARQAELAGFRLGDGPLLAIALLLLAIGLVMMTSASVEVAQSQYGDAFYHLKRQVIFLALGAVAFLVVISLPLSFWRHGAVLLYLAALLLLILVLVPGVGREAGGGQRWIDLGFMGVQASEPAKVFMVAFMAWYLSEKREHAVDSWKGFLLPLVLVGPPIYLLLLEPDFGAVVVLMIAVFGMMFLAGVKLHRFVLICLLALAGAAGLILSAPYRLQRVQSFLQSLSDPFSEEVVFCTGYQLAQALIGFGRGEWFGVGLGNSIQKLYFLPDAHTDFVLAIIAEELGFVGVVVLLGLFMAFVYRIMLIGRRNERAGKFFAAWFAYGLGFIFTGQILINVAVNTGLLPTKGLTLPFISYGGSSLITCLVMLAVLVRIDMETTNE